MILGNETIVQNLKGLYKNRRLGHGYIFYGPSMVGKRTVAQAFGKFLEKGEFALPAEGEVLQDFMMIDRAYMCVHYPDARGPALGIDAARDAKNFLWQRPNASPRRMLVVDDADLLTGEAQNALLKITEEPPSSSLLVFVTRDPDALLSTIRSRLPQIYFGTIPSAAISAWLTREHDARSPQKADAYAGKALGKPGLAWRLAHDAAFRADLDRAEEFLAIAPAGRKEFLKTLIEPDEFSMTAFLDGLMTVLAWREPSKGKTALWHKTLRLAENARAHPLHARLQLEALMR